MAAGADGADGAGRYLSPREILASLGKIVHNGYDFFHWCKGWGITKDCITQEILNCYLGHIMSTQKSYSEHNGLEVEKLRLEVEKLRLEVEKLRMQLELQQMVGHLPANSVD